MTNSEQPSSQYKEATERSGAIVIHPKLDPNMIYDPETKRVVDHRTGEYFRSAQMNAMNRIYQASINDKSGKIISGYEYRYSAPRLPDGEAKIIYEIIWSIRGDDVVGRTIREQIEGRNRAKSDSLERLASFLLAQSIGYHGGKNKGQTVLVDRRMDDERWLRF